MIDGHIHLERGDYTLNWLNRFVENALTRGIGEIRLLEHSHRFFEFEPMYRDVAAYSDYQKNWLARHVELSLQDYQNFVAQMRKHTFPVKIRFGLEVCYFEGAEDFTRDLLKKFNWDFVTGSVHWIDGFGFDHKPEFWLGRDVDATYTRYYEIMKNLIRSGLFETVAHPDSIKCFGLLPSKDLTQTYAEIADLLNATHMRAEMSAGLHLNYGCEELGMNRRMLRVFQEKKVPLITVSDAHRPEDVGRCIKEMEEILAARD